MMEIFNIGIPELIFILLIMLILLGPEGMAKNARVLGRTIRRIIHSPLWNEFMQVQQEIHELPTRMVREAGIEEINQEIASLNKQVRDQTSVESYNILPIDAREALRVDPSLRQYLDPPVENEQFLEPDPTVHPVIPPEEPQASETDLP